jgi:hypothetical protein
MKRRKMMKKADQKHEEKDVEEEENFQMIKKIIASHSAA